MKKSVLIGSAVLLGLCAWNPNLRLFSTFIENLASIDIVQKNDAEPSPVSIEESWTDLFNGKNLDGWKAKITGYPYGENYKNTFKVDKGVLKVDYSAYDKFNNSFGHLFYEIPFSAYRLKLEYRFVGQQLPDGERWATKNSGVMIHAQDPRTMTLDQAFPVSVEVQLLGGIEKNQPRPTANLCTPGTHVYMEGQKEETHCVNSDSDTYYGEEWIELEIVVNGSEEIIHLINGKEVMRYKHPEIGGEYNTLLEQTGKKLSKGYLALQSESHPIEFKNIKLSRLE